ncbi:MAG: phosphoribosylformylglycinamidine synthase subunit PurS [Candidatus Omnitrophica bacterium]|nr:phosphoribosylformylglycinamidine synthase subunit PurS [Candidatus Omnitrophota bacterium]
MKKVTVEIKNKPEIYDASAAGTKHSIKDLGIKNVTETETSQLFVIEGNPDKKQLDRIINELLTDTVTQYGKISRVAEKHGFNYVVDVFYKPGVTDAAGESALKAIKDMGIKTVNNVSTATRFYIKGKLSKEEIQKICEKLLANLIIQNYFII